MHKPDLALNNQLYLIRHKSNQTKHSQLLKLKEIFSLRNKKIVSHSQVWEISSVIHFTNTVFFKIDFKKL